MDSTHPCPSCHSTYRVELRPMVPLHSPAQGLALTVMFTIMWASCIAKERVTRPDSFPSIPQDVDAKYWARRLLADMADAGITPDGWEEAFFLDDVPVVS